MCFYTVHLQVEKYMVLMDKISAIHSPHTSPTSRAHKLLDSDQFTRSNSTKNIPFLTTPEPTHDPIRPCSARLPAPLRTPAVSLHSPPDLPSPRPFGHQKPPFSAPPADTVFPRPRSRSSIPPWPPASHCIVAPAPFRASYAVCDSVTARRGGWSSDEVRGDGRT